MISSATHASDVPLPTCPTTCPLVSSVEHHFISLADDFGNNREHQQQVPILGSTTLCAWTLVCASALAPLLVTYMDPRCAPVLISLCVTHYQVPSSLVQVQTPQEPEPDLKFSSFRFRFRFAKSSESDPKSSSGFGKICPKLD
jgi:hypothetical protein